MKRPNILFLFPDQHRGDWLPYDEAVCHTMGMDASLPLRMPNVMELMNNGLTFTSAITPSPLCAPARACLASGLRYDSCGVPGNHVDYPLEQKTFYSVLKQAGYSVGGVGKFDLNKSTHWWGLDGWREELETLGFTMGVDNAGKIDAILSGKDEPKDPYMKYLYECGLAEVHIRDMSARGQRTDPTPLPDEAYCDNWLTRNGIQLLRDFPDDRPWFLQVNFTGPHNPWDVTRSMREKWEHTDFPLPEASLMPPSESLSIRQNYAAMLENIDSNIGLLMSEVRRRGELENTIIVYSSDHGEMLGDCNKYGKTYPERGSLHIPLIICGPGISRGIRSDVLVELQDLASTFVEYAGAVMPEAQHSISLRAVASGQVSDHRELQMSAMGSINYNKTAWRTINNKQYKLISYETGETKLYDVQSDPWERVDLSSQREDIVTRLLTQLNKQLIN